MVEKKPDYIIHVVFLQKSLFSIVIIITCIIGFGHVLVFIHDEFLYRRSWLSGEKLKFWNPFFFFVVQFLTGVYSCILYNLHIQ